MVTAACPLRPPSPPTAAFRVERSGSCPVHRGCGRQEVGGARQSWGEVATEGSGRKGHTSP